MKPRLTLTRLEYKDDSSEKFWEIVASNGRLHTVRLGRIGTKGQTCVVDGAGVILVMVRDKIAKGYKPTLKGKVRHEVKAEDPSDCRSPNTWESTDGSTFLHLGEHVDHRVADEVCELLRLCHLSGVTAEQIDHLDVLADDGVRFVTGDKPWNEGGLGEASFMDIAEFYELALAEGKTRFVWSDAASFVDLVALR